jgi:hypothetical protein
MALAGLTYLIDRPPQWSQMTLNPVRSTVGCFAKFIASAPFGCDNEHQILSLGRKRRRLLKNRFSGWFTIYTGASVSMTRILSSERPGTGVIPRTRYVAVAGRLHRGFADPKDYALRIQAAFSIW